MVDSATNHIIVILWSMSKQLAKAENKLCIIGKFGQGTSIVSSSHH